MRDCRQHRGASKHSIPQGISSLPRDVRADLKKLKGIVIKVCVPVGASGVWCQLVGG